MIELNDTIAAISTPIGEGGLAVVRMSGSDALKIADRCFKPAKGNLIPSQANSHTIHYGHIVKNNRIIDEVMLTVLKKPHTYTREDMVEISCHGGILPARMVMETLVSCGARIAQPGEFTKRAFLNGRIDLTQAEAVIDVIHSRTELALKIAQSQLAGNLTQKMEELASVLMNILAHIEAHIDFPDEDIEPDTVETIINKISESIGFIEKLLDYAEEGHILRYGIKTAIIGKPNTGKSSLLNRLLGKDRAIVSPIPGTTRDTIEETANIRGIPIVFTDTAGLRHSTDIIEAEGINRTKKAIEIAEMLLLVMDASQPIDAYDRENMNLIRGKKAIIVINKSDLGQHLILPDDVDLPVVTVSCLTGDGIEELKDTICNVVFKHKTIDCSQVAIINTRHKEALIRAQTALKHTKESLVRGESLEFVAVDLRIAIHAVGEVTGKTATEDLLDIIFSQFCIGK